MFTRGIGQLSRNIIARNISSYKNNFNCCRLFSSSSENPNVGQGEKQLKDKLRQTFPKATTITVDDISGGCGSMYQILVESQDFKGLTTVKQHQLVTKALQNDIKLMHGIRITTSVPKS